MQLIINILITTTIYLLVANGTLITYSTTKFLNLAQAITITTGAYFTYFFSQQLGLSLWLSIPFAIAGSIIIGLFCEIAVFRPLRNKNVSSLILLIASLGIYIVLQNIISMLWGDNTKSIKNWKVSVGNEFLSAYITNVQITIIIVTLIFFIFSIVFLKYSKEGKKIRAVSSNEILSNIFGINSGNVIISSVILGSLMAAISGILVAFNTDMTPTMGFNLLLYGIVAMIIGGVGSAWGLVGGSLLLAATQNLGSYYISSQWMDAIAYIILILFLIWKPLGFSGKRLKKIEI